MIEVSKHLHSILSAYLPLTNVVQTRIYPLIANETVVFPFAVYGFGEVPYESKDACAYTVNVAVWFDQNKIIEAYTMADVLKTLAELNSWEFINTNVDYSDVTQKIFSEINFKIIM
ncbi:hypothetical protein P3875_04140 [Myroides sp. JBRI-B21084]|uniref:hypothetical protein n=1 Tax=Myroides sp. JBRI-B21084 TaxID=3119977 RepID=UPI0026E23A9F|nr:hypothetical protein [Paenimyroides cloacae]WKW47262.1 hypothetical protein P3875_04140 [Paenimyroides cloacae]